MKTARGAKVEFTIPNHAWFAYKSGKLMVKAYREGKGEKRRYKVKEEHEIHTWKFRIRVTADRVQLRVEVRASRVSCVTNSIFTLPVFIHILKGRVKKEKGQRKEYVLPLQRLRVWLSCELESLLPKQQYSWTGDM